MINRIIRSGGENTNTVLKYKNFETMCEDDFYSNPVEAAWN